jgi:hypothetical protein
LCKRCWTKVAPLVDVSKFKRKKLLSFEFSGGSFAPIVGHKIHNLS